MEVVNATSSGFSSVLAGTKYANVALPPQVEYVIEAVSNAGVWTWVFTFIALCVAYDQSMLFRYQATQGALLTRALKQLPTSSGKVLLRDRP